ncbi:NAD-dependent epimerase/dehydratase family protein [Candidatus Cloacimonadota bacterium]
MKKKILITGITGLIGRNTTRILINKHHELHALIRPGTDVTRFEEFKEKVTFYQVDLADISGVKSFLQQNSFDVILHIGALRGGRKFPNKTYFAVNVNTTEQLILNALENNSKFVFCSSVGVFGAIPGKLPADENTPRKEDNYYHYTKIRAESLIQNYILKGLKAVILRPAITYGPGDYGFPFTLTKLIDNGYFPITEKPVTIHLTNIELISQSFARAVDLDQIVGKSYNVADSEPVIMSYLADFINQQLKGKSYKPKISMRNSWLKFGEDIARFCKNELWTSRFELISKSWYYNVEDVYTDFGLKEFKTIPEFKIVTDWYKKYK